MVLMFMLVNINKAHNICNLIMEEKAVLLCITENDLVMEGDIPLSQ